MKVLEPMNHETGLREFFPGILTPSTLQPQSTLPNLVLDKTNCIPRGLYFWDITVCGTTLLVNTVYLTLAMRSPGLRPVESEGNPDPCSLGMNVNSLITSHYLQLYLACTQGHSVKIQLQNYSTITVQHPASSQRHTTEVHAHIGQLQDQDLFWNFVTSSFLNSSVVKAQN